MHSIAKHIKTKIFEISTILCFLLPPVGILLLFILSFATIIKTLKEKKQFHFSLISIFFLCLFISTIGAVFQMKNGSLFVGSIMILVYWGIYLRIMSNGSKEHFQNFRWIIIFGGLYNCLIGWTSKWLYMHPLLGLITGTKLIGDIPSKNYSRLIGSAYNPNFTMYLLLLAIAFIFAEMLTNIRKQKRGVFSWQVPTLLVLSNGVIATGSRAGFFAMIFIYFLFFLRLNKVIFIISSLIFLFQSKSLLDLMPRNETISDSYLVREKIWLNSIELWKQHFLFGTTPLGFKPVYQNLFNDDIPHAHNMFIGIFAEFGILGGVAFLILLFATIYKVVNLFFYKETNNGFLDYFLLSLPIIVLTGILDEPIFSPQIALLTIILLAYWDKYTKSYVLSYHVLPKIIHYLNLKKKNGS